LLRRDGLVQKFRCHGHWSFAGHGLSEYFRHAEQE
jgi:hypothetical protein